MKSVRACARQANLPVRQSGLAPSPGFGDEVARNVASFRRLGTGVAFSLLGPSGSCRWTRKHAAALFISAFVLVYAHGSEAHACEEGVTRVCRPSAGTCGTETCYEDHTHPCCTGEWPDCSEPHDNYCSYSYEDDYGGGTACYYQDSIGGWISFCFGWQPCTEDADIECECNVGDDRSCTPPGAQTSCGTQECVQANTGWYWGACVETPQCFDPEPPPPNGCNPDDKRGDPVDVRTGVTIYTPHREDAAIETPVGRLALGRFYSTYVVELDFERAYYALHSPPTAQRAALLSLSQTGWGAGWRHAYSYGLPAVTHNDPAIGAIVDGALFVRPDGHSEFIAFSSGSPVTTTLGSGTKFEAISTTHWRITTVAQDQFDFDVSYGSSIPTTKLREVSWNTRLHATLHYFGEATIGAPCDTNPVGADSRLCAIADDFGGKLWLTYNSNGTVQRTNQTVAGSILVDATNYQYTVPLAILNADGTSAGISFDYLRDVDNFIYNGSYWVDVDHEHYSYVTVRPSMS